ncbi:MAG: helix-turn-helix domain-containing protein [Ruminococcus sp.]|nr:helix-turn-helix domain-containing protein [Ruminococcus sp.]
MNKEIEKAIGSNLRKIRENKGMTQDGLAVKLRLCGCDVTRSAVAKIEVGMRHLYPDEIILLKKILGVSYEELLKGNADRFNVPR